MRVEQLLRGSPQTGEQKGRTADGLGTMSKEIPPDVYISKTLSTALKLTKIRYTAGTAFRLCHFKIVEVQGNDHADALS